MQRQDSRRRPSPAWWLSRAGLAVVAGLAIACGIDVARAGGPEAWLVRHRLPPLYVPAGRVIVVEGAAVYLDCRGAGSPTVLLEPGLGTGASGWGFVLGRVAEATRVCVAERPGIGSSDAIGRHTGLETMHRFRRTLEEAGEDGPFIVVGHSLGGVYARLFAAEWRVDVAGVVLVDPYLPDIRPIEHVPVEPDLRAEWLEGLRSTNELIARVEQLDWAATEAELARASIDGLPLELIFVDQRLRWDERHGAWREALIATWRMLLAELSSDQRLTIAENSGHLIQFDRPDVVVEAILRLVERARPRASAGTARRRCHDQSLEPTRAAW